MSSMIGDVLRLSVFGQSHSPRHRLRPRRRARGHRRRHRRAPALPRPARPRPLRHRHPASRGRRPRVSGRHHRGAHERSGHRGAHPATATPAAPTTTSSAACRAPDTPTSRRASATGAGTTSRAAGTLRAGSPLPSASPAAIALQALRALGIEIAAHIACLGPEGTADEALDPLERDDAQLAPPARTRLPLHLLRGQPSACAGSSSTAKDARDSVGGVIECAAYGVPAGIGDPMFDGIENRIARIAFGIPAVKGVDFGAGFAAAYLTGSQNNDPYRMVDGVAKPASNNAGGILGGIHDGMPVVWQMAVKPPPPSRARSPRSTSMPAVTPSSPCAGATTPASCRAPCPWPRPSARSRCSTPSWSTAASPRPHHAGAPRTHPSVRSPMNYPKSGSESTRSTPTCSASSASASTSRARWPRPRPPWAGPSSIRRASAPSSTASPRASPERYRAQAVALFSLLMSQNKAEQQRVLAEVAPARSRSAAPARGAPPRR